MKYLYRLLRILIIRVRNDLQCIFSIKKRIQLLKTVRLSTHIDIFKEKRFQNLFWNRSKKSEKFFLINNVKSAGKFMYEIIIDDK